MHLSQRHVSSFTHSGSRRLIYRIRELASRDNVLAGSAEIENAVVEQVRGLLQSQEIIVRTWGKATQLIGDIDEAEVRDALHRLEPVWNELFPAEQARIVHLLVEHVDVSPDGVDIRLRTEGLTNLTT